MILRTVVRTKIIFMKGSRNQTNLQSKQMIGHKPRPEIRDDLDSRKNEEQDTKGNDVTHNKKETKRAHLKNKKEDESRK